MTPPRKPRRAPPPPVARGAYGVVALADGAEFWCAWADATQRLQQPDATGFARTVAASPEGSLAETLFRLGVGLWAGVATSPGSVEAGAWLNQRAPGGFGAATIDHASAVMAWRLMGAPQAPPRAGAPSAGTPPASWTEPPREPPWWAGELGVSYPATEAVVRAAYRVRVHAVHPDKHGGDERAAKQLNRAYDAALAALGARR